MSNIVSDEIAKMQHLFNYRMDEGKKKNTSVEYHAQGADGNMYGIIKEGTKYYIKCAHPKDTEILAEDYDYIGGLMNKKRYEYNSYAMASKQFDLKMMSLNEACNRKGEPIVEQYNKQEQSEWCINETKEMRAELDRFNQIVTNMDKILNEENKKPVGMGMGTPKNAPGDPYVKINVDMNPKVEKCDEPEKADGTYTEEPKDTKEINNVKTYKDKGDNKVYTEKAPKINEGKEPKTCKIQGITFREEKMDVNGNPVWSTDDEEFGRIVNWRKHKDGRWYGQSYELKDDVKIYNEKKKEDKLNESYEIELEVEEPKKGTGCAKCETEPYEIKEEEVKPEDVEGFETIELVTDDIDDIELPEELENIGDEENELELVVDADGSVDESCDECGMSECGIAECGMNETFDRIGNYGGEVVEETEDTVTVEIGREAGREKMMDMANYMKALGYELFKVKGNSKSFKCIFKKVEEEEEVDFDDEDIELNEWKLDAFGKHPRYGMQPFTLPTDEDPKDNIGKNAKGGEYGKSKGNPAPYDEELDLLVDNIIDRILKKKVN